MLSIPNYYRRNANQNNNKKSNPSQNDHPQKSTNNKWGRGPGGEGTSLRHWWERTLAIVTRKGQSSHAKNRTLSRELCLGSDIPTPGPGILIKPPFKMTHTPQCSLQRYLKQPRHTTIKTCTDRLKLKEDVVHISTWNFTQPSAVNSMEKESKEEQTSSMYMSILNQVLYTHSKHKTTNWLYSNIGSAWGKGKKEMPTLFPATSLAWAAIPSLEPEQAVSHVWTGIALRKLGGNNQNFKRDG